MTVQVQGNLITIKNSAGIDKFNSNNKLVYQRLKQSSSVSLSTASPTIFVPFTQIGSNEFLVITIKITSSSGQADLINGILNVEIPANGGVVVDFFGRNVNNQAAVDSEILGVDAIGSSLVFRTYKLTNYGDLTTGTATTNLQYTARVWSFL